jgi:hypothetical protein
MSPFEGSSPCSDYAFLTKKDLRLNKLFGLVLNKLLNIPGVLPGAAQYYAERQMRLTLQVKNRLAVSSGRNFN